MKEKKKKVLFGAFAQPFSLPLSQASFGELEYG